MKHAKLAKGIFLALSPGGRWLAICTMVFCLVTAGYGTVHASSANITCNMTNCPVQLAFDGDDRDAAGWGASAIIGDYQVSGACQSSSAWTMIDNHAATYGFAQVGYIRLASWSTSKTYYFAETASVTVANAPVMLGVMAKGWGSSDTFVTYYDSSVHYIKMLINGTLNYTYGAAWSANEQVWDTETHSVQDYFPGGYNHHTIFANNQYLYNGAWHNIDALTYESIVNTPYGDYSGSGNTFYIWDTRIA
jgi:hypothetical protein